jgi:hypothetical protein
MHQPHDKLFKAGFSDPKNSAGFLRSQLPSAVVDVIDWSSLILQSGSFIDSQFRHSESDLLFHATAVKHPVAFYLLFEHQTVEDRHLALRLLRYMVRIWEKHLRDHPSSSLPAILPVVLAQNDRSWSLQSDFASLLALPDDLEEPLQPFVPDFAFQLIQLAEIPFEAIAGTPAGIMILRTLKAERGGELLSSPVWDEALLERLPRELFELIIRYILEADVDKDGFDDTLRQIRKKKIRSIAMSLAEKLRQEGEQKGRQEGRQEGRQDAIIRVLEVRLGPIPSGLVEAIRQVADLEKLDVLQGMSLTCENFEEFSKGL